MATASFLGLPPEVRLSIYGLVFAGREVALLGEQAEVRHSSCQILQTCHQINQEADPILHQSTLYIFGSPGSLTYMAQRNPDALFYHLRYVKLDIWLPSHRHIDYRGFCHLTISQWGTALRLLYSRPGRRLKHLLVVCRGPNYANNVPPLAPRQINPWAFQYSSIKTALNTKVRAENIEFSHDDKKRDLLMTGRFPEFVADIWHL